jgi:hypothetical protein
VGAYDLNTPLAACAVTLDTDWAPDFVLADVADLLQAHGVPATWFCTHPSPVLDQLRQTPALFELGIHPNFLPNSSQGKTPADVLRFCMDLIPEATSVRTHELCQSATLFALTMAETPVTTDVSLFLRLGRGLQPCEIRRGCRTLLRLPYFWEDDVEMDYDTPAYDVPTLLAGPGALRIFDFHPIHIYLNSADMTPYRRMQAAVAGPLTAAAESAVAPFVHDGYGTRTFFCELLTALQGQGAQRIRDIAAACGVGA